MAIVVPTEYLKWQGRNGEIDNTIILLTDGGQTWTLGNFESGNQWTGDHVYDMLTKDVSIKQKIDPINHNPSRAIVNLTLSNAPHYKNSTRLSNELGDIPTNGAAIYHMNSPYAVSLDDCLLLFSGSTQSIPDYNEKIIKVVLEDKGYVFDKEVLVNTVEYLTVDQGWTLNEGADTRRAPLMYGDWNEFKGTSKVWQISKTSAIRYIAANHYLRNGGSDLFIPVGNSIPAAKLTNRKFVNLQQERFVSSRMVTYASPVIDQASDQYLALRPFYLNVNRKPPNDTDEYDHIDQPFSIDRTDIPSHMDILDRIVRRSPYSLGFDRSTYVMYEIDEADELEKLMTGGSTITADLYMNYSNLRIKNNVEMNNFAEGVVDYDYFVSDAHARLRGGYACKIFNSVFNDVIAGAIYQVTSEGSIPRVNGDQSAPGYFDYARTKMGSSTSNITTTNRTWSFGLQCETSRVINDYPDGMWELSDIYLLVEYVLGTANASQQDIINQKRYRAGGTYIEATGSGFDANFAFISGQGRVYSEWRSPAGDWVTNFYTGESNIPTADSHVKEGQMIDESSGIIASILLEDHGIDVSELDWDSFAENITFAIRSKLNVFDNDVTIKDVIKDLCDQGMFTYAWTASGKMKLIPIRRFVADTPVSSSSSILYDDMDSTGLKIRKTNIDEIVNHITVTSRWHEDEQIFKDTDIYENSVSQAKYGIRKRELEFKNIDHGNRAAVVTNPIKTLMIHLIEPDVVNGETDTNHISNDGYWANQRIEIEFTATGSKHKHLDIGDYIDLDATSFDNRLKMFGASWTDNRFLITSIKKSKKGNSVVAERIGSEASIFGMRGLGILEP